MKNNESINFFIILFSLLIGFGISAMIYQPKISILKYQLQNHHQKESHKEDHDHLKTIEIKDPSLKPTLDFKIHPDELSGWNIELITNNFRFNPNNTSTKHTPGEGHAHLYINGKKENRMYSNWYHISNLPKGKNEIKVNLNTNDHQLLMFQKNIIESIQFLEVK